MHPIGALRHGVIDQASLRSRRGRQRFGGTEVVPVVGYPVPVRPTQERARWSPLTKPRESGVPRLMAGPGAGAAMDTPRTSAAIGAAKNIYVREGVLLRELASRLG